MVTKRSDALRRPEPVVGAASRREGNLSKCRSEAQVRNIEDLSLIEVDLHSYV
ncbi:hypothetical protein [Calothrix sp. NIES-2100]|uniref:hypothetical protein n=1 Tax=Calothrix sp. NIES-2100 TaxID=1954172 RepID=UPI0030D830F8